MASDPRRFDGITKVVRDQRRMLEDTNSTVLSRLAGLRFPRVVTTVVGLTARYTGEIVLNTTDALLYRYDGSAWVGFSAIGGSTAATLHEVRYEQHSSQSLVTNTDTKIKFDTAIYTSSDVTASGTGNTDFQLNRAGLWRASAAVRYDTDFGGNERHLFLQTGTVFNTTNRIDWQTAVNVDIAPASVSCSTEFRAAAGSSVFAAGWQNSGNTIATDVAFGGAEHLTLTWLRP
jgi:hypothetical protein